MADNNNWLSKVDKALTVLEGDAGHHVIEVLPQIAKKEAYQLASTSRSGLIDQASMFLALREYHEAKEALPDWDDFMEIFENCFPAALAKSPHWGGVANPWGRSFDQRPRFKNLYPVSAEEKKKAGFWLIEFWPKREQKEDSYLLVGNQKDIITQAVFIMQQLQIVANLNHVVGFPVSEHLKRAPKQGLTLQILFSNYPSGPYYKSKQRQDFTSHQVSIPFAKRSALKYETIRQACGGSSGLTWGRVKATAYVALSSDDYPANKKGMPQVWTNGSNYDEAKSNAKKLLQLSDAKIISFGDSEKDYTEGVEKERPEEDKPKKSYKIYPYLMFVENTRIVAEGAPSTASKGKKILLGKLNSKSNRLPLDSNTAPPWFDAAITELTKWEA